MRIAFRKTQKLGRKAYVEKTFKEGYPQATLAFETPNVTFKGFSKN